MPKQRHEAHYPDSMAEVFSALIAELGRHRWAEGARLDTGPRMPRVGSRYVNERGTVLRRGRVLECRKPVALTLYETLFDTPCRVRLRLRWRVEPRESGSLLRLDLNYELNAAASLRRRHWHGRLDAHCGRMFGFVSTRLGGGSATRQGHETAARDMGSGAAERRGQKHGQGHREHERARVAQSGELLAFSQDVNR